MTRPTSGPDEAIRLSLWVLGGVVAFLVAILAAVWLTKPARAHGPAAWIQMEPRYVDRTGIHCCGSSDCTPVNATEIHEDNDGVAYKGQRINRGERGVYWAREPDPPESQRFWVCWRHGVLRCIFRPQPGS